MTGAVVVWYAAGAVIALMVALELRSQRQRERRGERRDGPGRGLLAPLFWLAIAAAALIFVLWPWVAMGLAENASL